jgi:hypothetical protein
VNAQDLIPALLLTLLSLALTSGAAILLLLMHWRRQRRQQTISVPEQLLHLDGFHSLTPQHFSQRPTSWMAVRGRNIESVQAAFHLNNPRPCSWFQGLSGDLKLFIAPPIRGWIIIVGSGIPDPFDDVDACFRALLRISEKLGEVQLFCANTALSHHAWMRARDGKILRAYAWAGKTLWNQGQPTPAEQEIGMRCFEYFETFDDIFNSGEAPVANTEKVPLLAARWSIDPAAIDETTLDHTCGIAGEPPRLY